MVTAPAAVRQSSEDASTFADVSIIDIDSPNLASATVTLTNGDPLGSLTFNGTPPVGISFFGSGTHQITLSGAASAAAYKTALQQITFNNSDTNPSTETRVVDIVVNDGAHNSNTAQALIQVEVVNNSAPVLDLDPNDSGGSVRGTFRRDLRRTALRCRSQTWILPSRISTAPTSSPPGSS